VNLKFSPEGEKTALTQNEQVFHEALSGALYRARWLRRDQHDSFAVGGEVCLRFEDMQGKSTNRVAGVMFDPQFPEVTKNFTAVFNPSANGSVRVQITAPQGTGPVELSGNWTKRTLLARELTTNFDLTLRDGILEGRPGGNYERFQFFRVERPDGVMPGKAVDDEERKAREALKNGGLYRVTLTYLGAEPALGPKTEKDIKADLYLKIDPLGDNTNVFNAALYDPQYPDMKKDVRGFLFSTPRRLTNIHIMVFDNTGIENNTAKSRVQSYWLVNGVARFISLRVLGDSLVGTVQDIGFTINNPADLEFVRIQEIARHP
jgi:hypothetical protein